MDDSQYQVRVTALATERFPAAGITAAFAELFCLAPAEAEARLSGLPLLVRGDLSLEQARKYCRVLARRGLECELVPQRSAEVAGAAVARMAGAASGGAGAARAPGAAGAEGVGGAEAAALAMADAAAATVAAVAASVGEGPQPAPSGQGA